MHLVLAIIFVMLYIILAKIYRCLLLVRLILDQIYTNNIAFSKIFGIKLAYDVKFNVIITAAKQSNTIFDYTISINDI